MAEQSDLLKALRAALAAFDDESLAALANKGLVKRARKDLESRQPTIRGEDRGALVLTVEEFEVSVASLPKDSSCSCPAGGICRHVLAALLFLKHSSPAAVKAAVPSSCLPELLALDDAALEAWAGKPLVRRAVTAVARGLTAEFEDAVPAILRIPTANIVCRWMPGAGPEAMICSCHSREVCEHRVAAILALQVASGSRVIAPEVRILEEATGTPRTRAEVLAELDALLCELLALGLGRISTNTEQRLRTLAMSAHGVDLPRLERMIRSLADETKLLLARDAQASTSNFLNTASRIEALRVALATQRQAHVGQHRSTYTSVGELELVGLGARQWMTRSGYVGITVYFWDRQARSWATWSESRALSMGGIDPVRRYRAPGPWIGCDAVAITSRSTVRATGTWRNAQGRLSARGSTKAMVLAETKWSDVPIPVAKWSALRDAVYRFFGGGLGERLERDEIVLLQPASWGEGRFDPVRQEFVRPIIDADGRALPLWLPFTPENQSAIEFLENAPTDEVRGVLGLLRMVGGRLAVEPISILEDGKLINLNLDSGTHLAPVDLAQSKAEDEPEPDEEVALETSATSVGRLLRRVETLAERVAERGLVAYPDAGELSGVARRLTDLGLSACASAVATLAERLAVAHKRLEPEHAVTSRLLLRAYYLTQLTGTVEVTAVAAAGFADQA